MGKPRLIIIVRHGESEANQDKSVNRVVPNHKVSLTPRGHQQAHIAGEKLVSLIRENERVAFFTSPYKRARQTTEGISSVIAQHGIQYEVHEEPRMREQDFGNFQGDSEEMQRIWTARARYGHFFFRIPNGESAADVYDRCAGFNETLFRQFEQSCFPEILVLVSHGIWARVFLMKWFGWSYEKFESLRNVRHCQFLVMEICPIEKRYSLKTRLRTWNDTDDNLPESDGGEILEELELASNNSLSRQDLQSIAAKEKIIMEEYKATMADSPRPNYHNGKAERKFC